MAIKIAFGVQKGGVGKTTTAGVTAWLLSKRYRVLAIDFDSQGNLTQLLTQRKLFHFEDHTILEAIKEGNPESYIYPVKENLDLIPADDYLATLPRWLYTEYRHEPVKALRNTLAKIEESYDYIILDLPPNLGELTTNGFIAADYIVAILQSEPFCFDAIPRFVETLEFAQNEIHPGLRLAGILITMVPARGAIDEAIITQARARYKHLIFKSVINRRGRLKDFSKVGIRDNTAQDRYALEPYTVFVKELLTRVREKENV